MCRQVDPCIKSHHKRCCFDTFYWLSEKLDCSGLLNASYSFNRSHRGPFEAPKPVTSAEVCWDVSPHTRQEAKDCGTSLDSRVMRVLRHLDVAGDNSARKTSPPWAARHDVQLWLSGRTFGSGGCDFHPVRREVLIGQPVKDAPDPYGMECFSHIQKSAGWPLVKYSDDSFQDHWTAPASRCLSLNLNCSTRDGKLYP